MAQADEQVRQAVEALKAGRKLEARELLMAVVDQDERHEQAWLYLSALVDTLEEQQICLENVLAVNPTNEKARKGLEAVNQKLGAQPGSSDPFSAPFSAPPPYSPPAPPTSTSRSKSSPIGAEYASASGDSLVGGNVPGLSPQYGSQPAASPPPPADSESLDWLTGGAASAPPPEPPSPTPAAEQPDPFGIPTSVEWSNPNKPAAYGSGKQVDLPSAQEYDEWVQGLNISAQPSFEEADEPPAPFDAGGQAPFGDISFLVDSSPAPASPDDAPARSSAFGGSIFASSWESETAPTLEAGSPGTAGSEQAGFSAYDDDELQDADTGSSGPSFATGLYEEDSEDEERFDPGAVENIWADDLNDVPLAAAPAGQPAARSATPSEYFRYIPDDIEVQGGLSPRSLLLLAGVIVLAVLNVVSFAALLM